MSSQKIGPSSLASRVRSWIGAFASSDSMLPTTGLVGGCGIGLSLFLDGIVENVSPALSQLVIARSEATKQIQTFRRPYGLLRFARNDADRASLARLTQIFFYAIRSAWLRLPPAFPAASNGRCPAPGISPGRE